MTVEQFRQKVEKYLARTGEAPSSFGRRVMNNPSWVRRLRAGFEPREATRSKVLREIGR